MAERGGPAGVEEQGTFIVGPSITWEVLWSECPANRADQIIQLRVMRRVYVDSRFDAEGTKT
ncbi:MAG: hypothetical protein JO166_16555 [Deltaproteobacteria bacterium]|nr:hypothetical protein [Deltaproteobacteria bacterium]